MASDVEAYAGIATLLAGTANKFIASSELGGAASELKDLGQNEAIDILSAAGAASRALHQRSSAALQDIASLDALTASNIRTLQRSEADTAGTIAATYAGSGVEQTGSPLLAQLAASIETGRAIGVAHIRQTYGTRRLRFEAEQALTQAEDTKAAAEQQALSTAHLRDVQAASLQRRQLRTILSGVEGVTNPSTVRTVGSLFDKKKNPTAGYGDGGDY